MGSSKLRQSNYSVIQHVFLYVLLFLLKMMLSWF